MGRPVVPLVKSSARQRSSSGKGPRPSPSGMSSGTVQSPSSTSRGLASTSSRTRSASVNFGWINTVGTPSSISAQSATMVSTRRFPTTATRTSGSLPSIADSRSQPIVRRTFWASSP